eukprot:m.189920 g.189920  ORF g.189920 m.189920 type:complete len:129 (+) comp15436_c0_seq5:217-603(+)
MFGCLSHRQQHLADFPSWCVCVFLFWLAFECPLILVCDVLFSARSLFCTFISCRDPPHTHHHYHLYLFTLFIAFSPQRYFFFFNNGVTAHLSGVAHLLQFLTPTPLSVVDLRLLSPSLCTSSTTVRRR